MTKILIFSTAYFPLVGGAEVAVRELTDRLSEYEFELITARIQPGLPDTEMIGRVRVHRVGHGHWTDKFLMPWLAVKKAEELHSANLFQATWSIMASYAGFAAERFKKRHPHIPFLLTLQEGDPPEEIARKTRFVKGWFHNIFKRADAMQVLSHFLMDWGLSQGFVGEIAEVIPNGVDIERFTVKTDAKEREIIRAEYGISQDAFVVVTASRLVVKNGVDLLVRAIANLPEKIVLLIAGTGELEKELRALAKELDIEKRVVFAGLISHDVLPKLLASSDVFCRPSRSEGMGNAFIEAMAAGIPVIGTRVGGIPDIIEDGKDGLLIVPESSDEVASAVQHIIDDSELGQKLVQGGHMRASRMNWDTLTPQMESLFKKLLEG